MIVEKQETCTDQSQERKGPASPESVELGAGSEILDDSNQYQQDGIDFVLACLQVVMDQKSPAQVAARPDFSVTPGARNKPAATNRNGQTSCNGRNLSDEYPAITNAPMAIKA